MKLREPCKLKTAKLKYHDDVSQANGFYLGNWRVLGRSSECPIRDKSAEKA
jgi:hypothetical protein